MLKIKCSTHVKKMYFSTDCRTLLTIGQDVTFVTVLDLQKGKHQRRIYMPLFGESQERPRIEDIAVIHPNKLFVWMKEDTQLIMRCWSLDAAWDTPPTETLYSIEFSCKAICNQSKLLFLGRDRQIIHSPFTNNNETYSLPIEQYGHRVEVNSDCSILAHRYQLRQIIYLNQLQKPDVNPVIVKIDNQLYGFRFHPFENLLAVSYYRATQIFDAISGHPVSPRLLQENSFNQVEFTPTGKYLIAIGDGSVVRIWDTATYVEIAQYDFGIGPLGCLAISPDGLTFAVANYNQEIVVADLDA